MSAGLNMTDISKIVAQRLDLRASEVRSVLAESFEVLTDAVAKHKPVSISGFGSFRAEDDGSIDFRPGRHLKEGLKH